MENASKALIMAGAILISIIIISLGVMVFKNMAESVENEGSLDKQKIEAFNSRITPYVRESISASQVNALIQLVRTIDQTALNNEDTVQRVSVYYGSESLELKATDTAIKGTLTRVPLGKYYSVNAEYGNNGLINKLTISE